MKAYLSIFLLLFNVVLLSSQTAEARGFPDFTELVEDFAPSVVNISAQRERENNRGEMLRSPFWPFFQMPPGGQGGYVPKPRSEGSGFIISDDGYVLTNYHVIQNASKIMVGLHDQRELEAEIVGEDPETDVALLKIDAKKLRAAKIGNSNKIKVGEWVLAFGAPFGFDKTVTAGIISAKSRKLPRDQFVNFLQSDVAINPGNSGGPLVNLKGEVVGINSQIYSRDGAFAGVAFSIPIEIAMDVSKQLKEHGSVKRGFLGVEYQEVSAEEAKSVGLDRRQGALITNVVEDSPADKGGIKVGDIILAIDGYEINRYEELPIVVSRIRPGTEIKVKYFRGGKSKTTEVTLADRGGSTASVERPEKGRGNIGLRVEDLSRNQLRRLDLDGGVVVEQVFEGPAGEAGIRPGDVILSVNRKPIADKRAFVDEISAYKAGDAVSLLVVSASSGRKRFISFIIPEEK